MHILTWSYCDVYNYKWRVKRHVPFTTANFKLKMLSLEYSWVTAVCTSVSLFSQIFTSRKKWYVERGAISFFFHWSTPFILWWGGQCKKKIQFTDIFFKEKWSLSMCCIKQKLESLQNERRCLSYHKNTAGWGGRVGRMVSKWLIYQRRRGNKIECVIIEFLRWQISHTKY